MVSLQERILREQEQLQLERERLQREKDERDMWNRPQNYHGLNNGDNGAYNQNSRRDYNSGRDYPDASGDYHTKYSSLEHKPAGSARVEKLFEMNQKDKYDGHSSQNRNSFSSHVDTLSRKVILEMSKKPGLTPGKFQEPTTQYTVSATQGSAMTNQMPAYNNKKDDVRGSSNAYPLYNNISNSSASDSDMYPHQGVVELNRKPPNKWEHYEPGTADMAHKNGSVGREEVIRVNRRAPPSTRRSGEEHWRKERPSSGSWESSSQVCVSLFLMIVLY